MSPKPKSKSIVQVDISKINKQIYSAESVDEISDLKFIIKIYKRTPALTLSVFSSNMYEYITSVPVLTGWGLIQKDNRRWSNERHANYMYSSSHAILFDKLTAACSRNAVRFPPSIVINTQLVQESVQTLRHAKSQIFLPSPTHARSVTLEVHLNKWSLH